MLAPTALLVRWCRPVQLLAVVASLLLLGTILHLRPTPRHVLSVLEHYTNAGKSSEHPIFEIEGLALGRNLTRPSNSAVHDGNTRWLTDSLKSRFQMTMFPDDDGAPGYPNCSLNLERYAQTALEPMQGHVSWRKDERRSVVSFAINLRNSEEIIPAQALAFLEAITHLLRNNKVYVSIYENNSKDKTRLLLSDFGAALQAVGVDGLWIHSSNMLSDFDKQDRIVMLAEIRNLALAPLMPYASSGLGNETLVLMNDVMTCASDILELIHQQRLHQADMTFGMDWNSADRNIRKGEEEYLDPEDPVYDPDDSHKTSVLRFYDIWVGRGISGNMVYPFLTPGGFHPASAYESWIIDAYSTENETVYQRWLEGRAFPVYCGWGGMSAFDASLFTREHARFRSSIRSGWTGGSAVGALGSWGSLVSSESYLESDCPGASECEYIARDVWNLRQGKARIVLAPQARTTYNMKDWLLMGDDAPVTRRDGSNSSVEDAIDWGKVEIPQGVVCIASRTAEGVKQNLWDEDNHRTRLDPMWPPSKDTAADLEGQGPDSLSA